MKRDIHMGYRKSGEEKKADAKERAVRDRSWKHLDMITAGSSTLR